MARPKETTQLLKAYDLWSRGVKSAKAILLCLETELGDDAVHLRTVERWIADFKEKDIELDTPFHSHRMVAYGVPWEAGQYLLEMWAGVREAEIGLHIIPLHDSRTYIGEFTARDAKWCWYVHLAALDLDMNDVFWLAERFAIREMTHDLLGEPVELDDLQAYLAYGPWRSPEHTDRYLRAINEGRIPALKPVAVTDKAKHELFKLSGRRSIAFEPQHEWLPSEFIPLNDERKG